MINKENFRKYILNGEFKIAYEQFAKTCSFEELDNLLLGLAFDVQSIMIYAFICYLISINNCKQYHDIAQSIMCNPLCHIEGSYETALYHNRTILEIEPNNINAKLMLLFYNTLPEPLISDEESIKVARDILLEDPQNEIALHHLYKLGIEGN